MIKFPEVKQLTFAPRVKKESKHYNKQMATSSPAEIEAHNKAVTTRQVLRRQTRPWKHV